MRRILLPILSFVMLLAFPAPGAIRLKSGTVAGAEQLHPGKLERRTPGRSHYLAALKSRPDARMLAAWQELGIRVAGSIPPAAVILSIPDGADPRMGGVLWLSRLGAADKLSPRLGTPDEQVPGACVVEFYPDVDMDIARQLVAEAGMQAQDHPDLLADQILALGTPEQLASLAGWDEVAYVFPASQDLLDGAHVLACAGAVSEQGLLGQYVQATPGWTTGAGGTVGLSYVFVSLTPLLDASTVQSEVVRAFTEWAKYAPLVFSPGSDSTAARTIAIRFAAGDHGDGYPFTSSTILAHTFYPAPPNPEPIAGDMHFNSAEAWNNPQQIDLYSVALHEAGHALGLGHSDQPGAVMYPYYHLDAHLTDDDIQGIRTIYAAPATPPPPPPLSVQITDPPGSETVTVSSIPMSGTVSGGAGNPQVSWTSNQGMSGKASGSTAWTIAAVPLNLGVNIITVTALDSARNLASKVITVTRQAGTPPPIPVPTPIPPPPPTPAPSPVAPPTLQITSPAFTVGSTSAASIGISGTASAGTTSVTWSNSTGSSGIATGTTAWSATVPLIVGTNSITVKAFNSAGSAWRSLTMVRR